MLILKRIISTVNSWIQLCGWEIPVKEFLRESLIASQYSYHETKRSQHFTFFLTIFYFPFFFTVESIKLMTQVTLRTRIYSSRCLFYSILYLSVLCNFYMTLPFSQANTMKPEINNNNFWKTFTFLCRNKMRIHSLRV